MCNDTVMIILLFCAKCRDFTPFFILTSIKKVIINNFLIDMGSSMGFWFGLSVFGLTDLSITTIEWLSGLKEKAKNIFW